MRGARLGLASVAVTAIALTTAVDAGARARRVIDVPYHPAERALPIPRSFIGFSTEYRDVPLLVGDVGRGLNPVFRELVSGLTSFGNGPPTLRIGGGSSDQSWWNPGLGPRPAGIFYDITTYWLRALADFQRATNMRLLLGLNLAIGAPDYAVEWATAAASVIPSRAIAAFELGNEPEIYTLFNIVDQEGKPVRRIRPRGWDYSDYREEFAALSRAVRSAVPGVSIAGPAVTSSWVRELSLFGRQLRQRADLATVHFYPFLACSDARRTRLYPTRQRLLSEINAERALIFEPALRTLRRVHLPVHVSEGNSAACGGRPGVSDAFASSLWALDTFFLHAHLGYRGFNLHTTRSVYSPVLFNYSNALKAWQGRVNPTFYAMRFFAEATRNRARLLRVPTYAYKTRGGVRASVWATRDRTGRLRFVVITKNRRARRALVRIRIPRARRRASLASLSAPSLGATSGIRLAGQSWATPTTDGRLSGRRRSRTVRARRGVYSFRPGREGAYLLTVPRPPKR